VDRTVPDILFAISKCYPFSTTIFQTNNQKSTSYSCQHKCSKVKSVCYVLGGTHSVVLYLMCAYAIKCNQNTEVPEVFKFCKCQTLLLLLVYSHYTGQPVLAGTLR